MTAPLTRLFLGCDLVGSTAFKQRDTSWPMHFLSFYRQFPQLLAQLEGEDDKSKFKLWKAIGDELIFFVEVQCERDVLDAIETWVATMDRYEADTLRKVGLRTKGGAFLASFPGPNSEATVPRDPATEESDADVVTLNNRALRGRRAESKFLYDYFGPSFDTGFRVFGQANARYFTLSVEAAHALLEAVRVREGNSEYRALVYRGAHEFKGVWGGREYPLFAIDRQRDDDVNVQLTALNGDSLDLTKAELLCRACVDSSAWRTRAYLPGSTHPSFSRKPENVLLQLAEEMSMGEGAEELPTEKPRAVDTVPTDLPTT